jgi:hypothetical protein
VNVPRRAVSRRTGGPQFGESDRTQT